MGRVLGLVAGTGAMVLAVARLRRLLSTEDGFEEWQVIIVASAVLGGVVWWLVTQMILRPNIGLLVFTAAGITLLLRIAVPETLVGGFLLGPKTWSALRIEMSETLDIVRHGIPPVAANDGLVAVLAALVFLVGAAFAWGTTRSGTISAAIVPSFVLYLQFAVFDREPAGPSWMTAGALVLAVGTVAVALERRPDSGGARDSSGSPMRRSSPRAATAMAALLAGLALIVASGAGRLISEAGLARGVDPLATGLFGNTATNFDRWVDLRQSLLNPTGQVMFTAVIQESGVAPNSLYWRMETLDTFDGASWTRSDSSAQQYSSGDPIGEERGTYLGTTSEITQAVRIEGLRTGAGIAPTAGVPTEIQPVAAAGGISPSQFEVLDDASIAYSPSFTAGDTYQVASDHPVLSADLAALATQSDGQLSPIFAKASEVGAWSEVPEARPANTESPDSDRYLALPADLPQALSEIAIEQTRGASTDFERAWLLQSWFRDSGEFNYSTEVSTGHGSLDLAAWLGDPTSLNYRTGYCEQFAASMAVLARTLGIESRVVWGFTPGTLSGDGSIVVLDSNAHAWVELWIDGFGWVPFEPTPRSGVLPSSFTEVFDASAFAVELAEATPEVDDPDGPFDPPVEPTDPASGGLVLTWWPAVLIVVMSVLAVIPTSKWVRRSRRTRRLSDGEVAAAWDEMVDRLRDLGTDVQPSLTPLEFAHSFDERLAGVATRYSEEIYGNREGRGQPSDLAQLETLMRDRYGPVRRASAIFNPRSLLK